MATVPTQAKTTKAEIIARRLTEDIVSGRYAPGSALDETAIAARYGVSRTPIREAIRQLSASGVVQSRPHRGAIVADLSERQLDEIFAVMADLEALCARAAAVAMTTAQRGALQSLLDASRILAEREDEEGYSVLNEQFHEAIYRGSHNAYLGQLTVETRAKLAPYRRAQFVTEGRLERSFAEHQHVVEAIRAHDPGRAFDAMRAHIVVVRTAVDRLVQGRPEGESAA